MTPQAQNVVSWDDLLRCNGMSKRDAAVFYARLGLPVIQLHFVDSDGACSCSRGPGCPSKGKHPVDNGWFTSATTDPAQIAATWARAPESNVGVVPARAGLAVLDIDVKRAANGAHFFAGTHESTPGPAAATPSGGAHRLFLRTDECPASTSRKDFGFDWMSTSGQIVVAPSVTDRGAYRWTRGGAPGPTPAGVLAKLTEARDAKRDRDVEYAGAPPMPQFGPEDILPGVELNAVKGDRSEAIFGLAATLWQRGHTAAQVMATLLNTQAGLEKSSDESGPAWLWRYSVWAAAEHGGGYDVVEQRMRGAFRGFAPVEPVNAPLPGGEFADWFPAPHAARPQLDMHDFSTIDVEDVPPVEFVVPGLFPRGILTSLYGADGVGKTMWTMMQMMLVATEPESDADVAAGMQGKPVLFMTAEDLPAAIRRRVQSIARFYGLPPRRWAHNLHIPDLMDEDVKWMLFDRDNQFQLTPFAEETMRLASSLSVILAGLDPISDIYEDEENVRNRVAPFLRGLNRFCFTSKIAGLLLGHPAKSEGSTYSGSGAWSSKVRSRLFLRREEVNGVETILLTQEKSSYGPKVAERRYVFTPEGVLQEVGAEVMQAAQDQQGRTAAVVVLDGIRRLGAAQIATSVAPSARNHPAKMIVERGWDGGLDVKTLTDAVLALIEGGVLGDGVPFDGLGGRPKSLKANRQPRLGVWFMEAPSW